MNATRRGRRPAAALAVMAAEAAGAEAEAVVVVAAGGVIETARGSLSLTGEAGACAWGTATTYLRGGDTVRTRRARCAEHRCPTYLL